MYKQDGIHFMETKDVKRQQDGEFIFALAVERKGLKVSSWNDQEGVVLQAVDHHPSQTEATAAKRLNAQYHLPPFLLMRQFPGVNRRWLVEPRGNNLV